MFPIVISLPSPPLHISTKFPPNPIFFWIFFFHSQHCWLPKLPSFLFLFIRLSPTQPFFPFVSFSTIPLRRSAHPFTHIRRLHLSPFISFLTAKGHRKNGDKMGGWLDCWTVGCWLCHPLCMHIPFSHSKFPSKHFPIISPFLTIRPFPFLSLFHCTLRKPFLSCIFWFIPSNSF